jgi:hypothetical protein
VLGLQSLSIMYARGTGGHLTHVIFVRGLRHAAGKRVVKVVVVCMRCCLRLSSPIPGAVLRQALHVLGAAWLVRQTRGRKAGAADQRKEGRHRGQETRWKKKSRRIRNLLALSSLAKALQRL